MFDENSFNFDAMKEAVGVDPFAQETKKYARDERFYTLSKDEEGNGVAIVRFLPDSEKGMIQKLFKVNTTISKNGKKRFVSEFSPSTIGQPCPFQERWQDLWNQGIKDDVKNEAGEVTQYGSKTFGRGVRYVVNMKVLKDPANPDNEGKIFLYEMSGAMKDKLQAALQPSEQDMALGEEPKQLFNPLKGNNFKLACKRGSNNQINYDPSAVVDNVTSIYDSVEEALEDIKENTHKLSSLLDPESFMSYDELTNKLNWVTFQEQQNVQSANTLTAEASTPTTEVAEVQPAQDTASTQEAEKPATTTEVKTEAPAQKQEEQKQAPKNDDLDALLDGLV